MDLQLVIKFFYNFGDDLMLRSDKTKCFFWVGDWGSVYPKIHGLTHVIVYFLH